MSFYECEVKNLDTDSIQLKLSKELFSNHFSDPTLKVRLKSNDMHQWYSFEAHLKGVIQILDESIIISFSFPNITDTAKRQLIELMYSSDVLVGTRNGHRKKIISFYV